MSKAKTPVRFEMGQRVRVTRELVKDYGVDGDGTMRWASAEINPREGIVVGYRDVQDGRTVYVPEDTIFGAFTASWSKTWRPNPDSTHRYWIVFSDLRRRPVFAADDGIEAL